MGQSDLHAALAELVARLNSEGIPYALVGALALGEYGHRRATQDIDLLLTREGLERLRNVTLGRGYVEKFPGSKGMRDTVHGVPIDVVITGDFPGDGKPKPVAFPDPATAAMRGGRIALLPLERLVELKLASGISAPHRLQDLADVLALIRARQLPLDFEEQLSAYVREKYRELWHSAQAADRDE